MKKLVYLAILLVVIVAMVIPATCASEGRRNKVSGTGTVTFIELEGGFFGIVGDDGKKYDPLNLSKDFQQDGLKVHFTASVRPDIVTIRQWGTIVEITKIERLAGR